MFKPVSGTDLSQFDEKTKALYRMRESDPRLTEALLRLPRTSRNYVPIVAHEGNAYVKEREHYQKWIPYKLFAGMMFFTFAGYQF